MRRQVDRDRPPRRRRELVRRVVGVVGVEGVAARERAVDRRADADGRPALAAFCRSARRRTVVLAAPLHVLAPLGDREPVASRLPVRGRRGVHEHAIGTTSQKWLRDARPAARTAIVVHDGLCQAAAAHDEHWIEIARADVDGDVLARRRHELIRLVVRRIGVERICAAQGASDRLADADLRQARHAIHRAARDGFRREQHLPLGHRALIVVEVANRIRRGREIQ